MNSDICINYKKTPKKPELNSFDQSIDDEDISNTINTNPVSNLSIRNLNQIKYKLQIIGGHFESQELLTFLEQKDTQYENIYQRNNILKENLDFTKNEKEQFITQIVDKMKPKKILGSRVYWGILLGLLLGIICLYFLSKTLPLYLVIIISFIIAFVIAVIGYWMKNKIKQIQLLIFDIKLLNQYQKWTKKKINYFRDDINKRRILMENYITKYLYCQTHEDKDQENLKKKFLKDFIPILIQNKKCVFLSMRLFFSISQRLSNSCYIFVSKYYNRIIYPLNIIFQDINLNEPGFKEFKEILLELSDSLNFVPLQNFFSIGKYDPNCENKSIFVTQKFSLFSSHESFLKFNNMWEEERTLASEILNYKLELSKRENSEIEYDIEELEQNENLDQNVQSQLNSIFDSQLFQQKSIPILEKLCEIAKDNNPNFKQVIHNNEMKIEKIQTEESPVVLVRASIIIETKAQDLFTIIHDLKWRTQWDKVLSKMQIIERIDDNTDILYSYFKSPMGVSNRDFLQKRHVFKDTKNWDYIMVLENCEHPKCPPVKDAVRAHTVISGYLIKQINDTTCTMTTISQTDIKGMVPSWIVNFAASKAPVQWLKKMKEGIKLIKTYNNKN